MWLKIKKNKQKQKLNVGVWYLFAASLVIIIFFMWYFLIYVNGNEKLLIQKSFRVLNQVGENFKDREDSFRELTKSGEMKYHLNSDKLDFKGKNKIINRYFSGMETADSSEALDKKHFYFSKDYNLISDSSVIVQKDKSHISKDSLVIGQKAIYFKINKKDFFEPLERKDVFEEIIIIKENPKRNSNSTIYKFIYSSFPGDIDVKNLDSLITTDEGLSSGIVKDIELSGIEYVLFIKQIELLNNEKYYIGGVINKENYGKKIRYINAYIALLLLIIFFVFLFSIPLIKLRMISENLQLKISDLLLSAASILFGAFFTLLVILSLFSRFQREENVNKSLTQLSDSICVTLISEIRHIDTNLDKFMKVARKRDTSNYEVKIDKPQDSLYLKNLPYKYYKLIFDLDTTGKQIVQTSSRKKPVSSWDNYSFRRYFKESGEWRLDSLDSLEIMLDFIVSNTSGENLGVVSKRNKEFRYVITSRLYSVINTILPAGYGFCVIDKKGDVKFHSNSEKMLQENFIEESENSHDLKQAIYGNLNTHFSANYIGKNHLCYVQQINSLPLYMVTFYDQSYLNSVNLKITNLTFIFSLLVLFMFFLIVIGFWVVINKRTELNRNLDLFYWLKPNKIKIEKFKNIYIANIIAIALMIAACIISNPENVILIIFLFIITQIVTTYCYMNFISWDHFKKNYLMGSLFPSVIIISLLLYFAFKALPRSYIYHIFVFNFLLIAANFIVIRISANIFSGFKDHTHFYIYLYSWLSLIVITPVFIFFITFYNHEVKSDIAHNLYTYAKKEAVRNYDIDKFYHDNVQLPFHAFKDSLKGKGVYYLKGLSGSPDSTEFVAMRKDSIEGTLDQILFHLKPDLDQQSNERKSLVKKLDNYYKNENIEFSDDSVIIKYTAEQIHYSNSRSTHVTYYYKGEIDKFGFGKTERWISFLVIILFFCYIFFKLLKFVSDKVPISTIGLFLMKESFLDVISEHIGSKNNLMIQFSSACEKKAYDNKKDEEKYFSTINPETIKYDEIQGYYSNSFKESTERILVQNVHIDFKDPQADCEKLSIINHITEDDNIQLTLILNCSFAKIIDDNEQLIELEEDKERLKQLKSLQKILKSINNKFVHLFPPLTEKESITEDEKVIERKSTLEQVKAVIKNELSVSDYLKRKYEQSIKECAAKIVKERVTNPREKIILKIQEYAMGYYESIWEACSNSEKILLYDISDDLLLNDKNKKVIKILLNKGLLKYNGYIDIMNKSFRNFIVTKFESEYKEEYIKKYESSGKWANYRAPILMIVLALAFFIALQENILSNITSILPAIIAALGLITKVSGIFSKSNVLTPTADQSN